MAVPNLICYDNASFARPDTSSGGSGRCGITDTRFCRDDPQGARLRISGCGDPGPVTVAPDVETQPALHGHHARPEVMCPGGHPANHSVCSRKFEPGHALERIGLAVANLKLG